MQNAARDQEVIEADAFLLEAKRLLGAPPEWAKSTFRI